jgi:hypothetical protein
MNRIVALVSLLAATIGTYALVAFANDPGTAERETALVAHGAKATDMSHYVAAAARDLGFKQVRAYGRGVFIEEEGSHVSFFQDAKKGYVMNVGFDTRYRMPKAQLAPALDDLQAKGARIWQKAQALKDADGARSSTVTLADTGVRPAG